MGAALACAKLVDVHNSPVLLKELEKGLRKGQSEGHRDGGGWGGGCGARNECLTDVGGVGEGHTKGCNKVNLGGWSCHETTPTAHSKSYLEHRCVLRPGPRLAAPKPVPYDDNVLRGQREAGGERLRIGEEARCMCGWQHTHMLMHDTTRDIAGDVTCSLGATWFRICVNTERFFALSHAKRRARLALP